MDYRSIARKLPWGRGVKLLECDPNGLLAVEKPAGVLSHPNKKGDKGRALLETSYDADEQAFRVQVGDSEEKVFLLNRLDSATSGVVLLALKKDTALAVLDAFEKKKVRKTYQALVFGSPRGGPPLWRDRLSVKRAQGGVRATAGGGASAETKLINVQPYPGVPVISRLTMMPITGKTHQLRVQTSKRFVPIVGDRTYGDFQKNKIVSKKGLKRLCLHCVETELEYYLEGRLVRFRSSSSCPF